MKKIVIVLIVMIISLVLIFCVTYSSEVLTYNYENAHFNIKYDSTWKVQNTQRGLKLKHKKTNSVLSIQSKLLENNYLNTDLKDIIKDIIYSVEEQNKDYKLINMQIGPTDKYDSYSYLYEKEMKQVLVNIYKKDTKLVIVYYEADSNCYDIVLDSVDTILNSLDIVTGEKVN